MDRRSRRYGGEMSVRARVEKIEEECDGVWSQYGVTSWERNFLESVKERSTLSDKQEEVLGKIEVKVFEEN